VLSILLLLGAFLVLALRLMLQSVPHYGDEVEAWLSDTLGQSVTIGVMRSSWQGWRSVLVLGDVHLLDAEGRTEQQFEEMQVVTDLRQLLLSGRTAIGRIRLSGARLEVERRADGSIVLGGLGELSQTGAGALPGWLVAVGEVELQGSELVWLDRAGGTPQVRLGSLNGRFHTDGMQHRLNLSARLPPTLGQRVQVELALSGPWDVPQKWTGDLHIEAGQLQLEAWLGRMLDGRVNVRQGSANAELWGRWSEGRLQTLDGTLAADGVHLSREFVDNGSAEPPLVIDELSTELRWSRVPEGWALELAALHLLGPSGQWPASRARVTRRVADQGAETATHIAVSYLRVDDAAEVLRRFGPVSAGWAGTLRSMAPSGAVNDLRLDIPASPGALRYRFDLNGLSVTATGKVPGLSNLTARVSGEGSRGTVRLDTSSADVTAPALEDVLTLRRLQGELEYGPNERGFGLVAREIMVADEHIDGRLRMSLQIPSQEGQSPFLDLQLAFEGPAMARVTRYLPMRTYKPRLYKWLHGAFDQGRVARGDLIFYGPLHKFPFADGAGLFEARLETEDASVNYHPEWPAMDDVASVVVFRNTAMHVTARSGRLLDSRVSDVTVDIPRLGRSSLQVQGAVQGDAAGLFRFIAESPLRVRYAALLRDLQLSGDSDLSIKVDLSLKSKRPARIQGEVMFRDAQLDLVPERLRFAKLNGMLEFGDSGLNGPDLRGRVLGVDVALSVVTVPGEAGDEGSPTWVRVRGRFDPKTLARRFPLPVWDMLEGTTEAEVSLRVPARAIAEPLPLDLQVRSDLAGLTVRLPQPLGKRALDLRPLSVSTRLDGGSLGDIGVVYGETLRARVSAPVPGASASVHAHFGPGRFDVRDSPGVHLTGELQELDLSAWLELASGSGVAGGPALATAAMDIGELKLAGQRIHEAEIRLEGDAAKLTGSVRSKELEGILRIPLGVAGRDRPIDLKLGRLVISDLESGKPPVASLEPGSIPPLHIAADEFTVAGINLGSLLLVTSRTERGQRLETLRLESDDFRAEGRGIWEVQDGAQRSEFRGDVYAEALSKLLKRLGFAGIVEDGETNISATAGWQGGPQDFSMAGVSGDLRFDIGPGRFLDLEPGVGRVFGLMNLQAILRRLTLDFSDFFAKGYSFDKIEGDFSLSEGDAYAKRLVMKSPSSSIEVAGRTGLVDRDYDQQVTVIPKVSTSLPIAGVLAGGPAVGGALLLAQQLIGSRLDRISKIRYEVTGSWNDPVIARLRRLDRDDEDADAQGSEGVEEPIDEQPVKVGR